MTPDTVVLQRAGCSSIESMTINNQMRWAGNVVRMPEDRLPKQLFYGELINGKRPAHKPMKRFKDYIKNNLKAVGMNVGNWEADAANRAGWRQSVKQGCSRFEEERIKHAKTKRDVRKGEEIDFPAEVKTWKCEECDRVLLSKAGYVNHVKVHGKEQNQSTYAHFLPPKPEENTCVVCGKMCKSSFGLKRHTKIHKDVIPQIDAANPVKTILVICDVCLKTCKSCKNMDGSKKKLMTK